jgi:hypothetical protein
MRLSRLFLTLSFAALASACGGGSDSSPSDDGQNLTASTGNSTPEWFYDGPLPVLEDAVVTVSQRGHTLRVTGFVANDVTLPSDLPHVRVTPQGDRTQVDVVYPIATAANPANNAKPGVYNFQRIIPYRPNGEVTNEGFVTWGGFPFLEYDDGIAMHGPITSEDSGGDQDVKVWLLRRGDVSHGCNRMMGEHVIELASILGINMHRRYKPMHVITQPSAKVQVISDFDTFNGKLVDVDYPTDVGAERPTGDVEMFGSWVASETADGHDLPPDTKWEGGVVGKYYAFKEHMRQGVVCSVQQQDLPKLANFVTQDLPQGFCSNQQQVLGE